MSRGRTVCRRRHSAPRRLYQRELLAVDDHLCILGSIVHVALHPVYLGKHAEHCVVVAVGLAEVLELEVLAVVARIDYCILLLSEQLLSLLEVLDDKAVHLAHLLELIYLSLIGSGVRNTTLGRVG